MNSRAFSSSFVIVASLVLQLGMVANSPARPLARGVVVGTELNDGRPMSCREAMRHLSMRGLTHLRSISCNAPRFIFRGERRQQTLRIEVRARDGRVVRVDRVMGRHGR